MRIRCLSGEKNGGGHALTKDFLICSEASPPLGWHSRMVWSKIISSAASSQGGLWGGEGGLQQPQNNQQRCLMMLQPKLPGNKCETVRAWRGMEELRSGGSREGEGRTKDG